MNKKILVFGVLAALMLVSISFASAVTTSIQITRKKSPLFGIRTGKAIDNTEEKLSSTYIRQDDTDIIFTKPHINGQYEITIFYPWTNMCMDTSCNPSLCSRAVECFPSVLLPACWDSLEYYVQNLANSQHYL